MSRCQSSVLEDVTHTPVLIESEDVRHAAFDSGGRPEQRTRKTSKTRKYSKNLKKSTDI